MNLLKKEKLPYIGTLRARTHYILYFMLLFKTGQRLGSYLRNCDNITHAYFYQDVLPRQPQVTIHRPT